MEHLKEYFKIASTNLQKRSLRSWLTILGIVIGVFLIVSLLSLSEGIKTTITKQLKAMGGEMIFVMPGDISNPIAIFLGGEKLEKNDLDVIQRATGVEKVLTMSYQSAVARYGKEGKTVFLAGVPLIQNRDILEKFQGWVLEKGDWPKQGRREVLIGQQVANELFDENIQPGKEISLRGRKFKVAGILNSLGSKTDDSSIYLETELYRDLTGEKQGTAQMAMVKIKDGAVLDQVAKDIKESLQKTRKHRAGTDALDFSVITSEKMGEIAGGILAIIQIAIVAFASIAILVGGIGIMNTMFTAVQERTREIGIMKAIGAKNSAILSIFLIEAGIIGFIGGVGGTFLGVILAKIIAIYGQVHPVFYISASVTPGLFLFGLSFSFIVGCLAGFFPARKATQLKPVEALRRHD